MVIDETRICNYVGYKITVDLRLSCLSRSRLKYIVYPVVAFIRSSPNLEYGTILYHFRDKAIYWSKIEIFQLLYIGRSSYVVPVGISA